jgi:c-di-GMP-binding flagellar brake protein YcgR
LIAGTREGIVVKNRRAHIRYDFRNEISYARNSGTPSEVLKAITVDISSSGVGIYAFTPLRAGQQVTITDGLAGTYRKCTVAWCKELGDDVFRAGLFFRVTG